MGLGYPFRYPFTTQNGHSATAQLRTMLIGLSCPDELVSYHRRRCFWGGALLFGLRTSTMPVAPSWSPHREEEPGWFWTGAAIHTFAAIASFAAFIGSLR